jgi:hypothetical protein
VRFGGPVRWRADIPYGPAVIGTTDPFDPILADATPITGFALVGLDLESPPLDPSAAGAWPEAVRLGRFVTSRNGRVERCRLRGGTIEAAGGPWTFVGNTHRGVLPGSYSPCVFSVHYGHDLLIDSNRTESVAAESGKTWRFLVLTDSGSHDRVSRNTITGVGPRDTDTIPSMNMPEIILTESYRLHFEGRPAAIEREGRLLQLPPPQGDPARTGDLVAVLDGPGAGGFVRVAQALDPQTLWLESAIDPRTTAVSVATGFRDLAIESNLIDARGGAVAAPLVLVGNTFGLRVVSNRLMGGGDAFKITSCATEAPIHWGWSHAPMLGATIEGNELEGSERGGWLGVEWDAEHIKTSAGRIYFSAAVRNNRAGVLRVSGQRSSLDTQRVTLESNTARITTD